jgi:hypothetical protein
MSVRTVSAYWKVAGISFARYTNVSAAVIRASTNEDYAKKNKFNERGSNLMQVRNWENGVRGPLGIMFILTSLLTHS